MVEIRGGYERVQSDVVITGYRLNAKEPAQKALERILGMSPEAARTMARSFPAVVVQGAANDNAERIRAQLEHAGALVELRSSPPRGLSARAPNIERAPLDLPPMGARGGAFDLDLDLPMGGGGGPAKANKSGTGSFTLPTRNGGLGATSPRPLMNTDSLMPAGYGAPPKTGAFAAPAKTGTGPFAASPKTGTGSLAIPAPPSSRVRVPQPTSRSLGVQQPPPPPPAAYQLGDFGVAPRGLSVVAKLPSAPDSLAPAPPPPAAAPPMPTLADGDFDFESGGPSALELDLGSDPRQSLARKPSLPHEEILGERFGNLTDPRAAKAPDVDRQVMRSLERRPDSRRPIKREQSLLDRLLDGPWLSILMLVVIAALTLGAVGYALDPADPLEGLAHAKALPTVEPDDQLAHREGYLHPLLRSIPRPLRAPVAALLRQQISGVHEVPVTFAAASGQTAQCALIEQGADIKGRLKQLRETGHEVQAPPTLWAKLTAQEHALRAELGRSAVEFARVCLAP